MPPYVMIFEIILSICPQKMRQWSYRLWICFQMRRWESMMAFQSVQTRRQAKRLEESARKRLWKTASPMWGHSENMSPISRSSWCIAVLWRGRIGSRHPRQIGPEIFSYFFLYPREKNKKVSSKEKRKTNRNCGYFSIDFSRNLSYLCLTFPVISWPGQCRQCDQHRTVVW